MALESYGLKLPKAVFGGKDALGKIPEILAKAGATKVAAFTDKGLVKLGLFSLIALTVLTVAGLEL